MVYVDSNHESIRISTNETDKREITTNENSPTMRSYDCTFCKRGFTNAQALGGHMNIHRKDKAKAKKLGESAAADKAFEYFSPLPNEQAQFYASLRANKSYQIYASSQNNNFSHAYSQQSASHQDLLTPYGDFMGLKLKLGLPISKEKREEFKMEEHGERNWFGNEQVDLELRLGQNPY